MKNRVFEYYIGMHDGIKLYTCVSLPENGTVFPVIINRSPYYPEEPFDKVQLEQEELHGYARISQHCRGTGLSEGDFIPYINERNDGISLLEWVRKQAFYNGEIFLTGGSYGATVHWSYLDGDHPDIKGAFLAVQDTEKYNVIYRHGFYKPGLHGNWAVKMYKLKSVKEKNFSPETWLERPLCGITEKIFGEKDVLFEEDLLHPDPLDPYWKTPAGGSQVSNVLNRIQVPVCLVTSWYDIYTGGICDMWRSLSPERKKDCAFVITPFTHSYNNPHPTPDHPECPGGTLSENEPFPEICWFDHLRKGSPSGFFEKGKVKYYRMWENAWYSGDDVENGSFRRDFYLTPDRRLAEKPENGEITYLYDPDDPAEFKGGCCMCFGALQLQDPPDSRQDIISFESAPLEETDTAGSMELILEVSTTAPDSCFYARADLVKNGKVYPLRDEIDSVCRTVPEYRSGDKAVLKFVFTAHSFRIEKGDRLRLDISSSCTPHFLVHPNRKGNIAEQTGADTAYNTVFTGRSKLSVFCVK